MARSPAQNDFVVPVEKIGTFVFGRRTMADEVRIQVEYSRLTEGVPPSEWLSLLATWLSVLKIMTVSAPEGWNVDEMDPTDEDTYTALFTVHSALVTKEGSFRNGKKRAAEKAGTVPSEDAGVLVPPSVPPAA